MSLGGGSVVVMVIGWVVVEGKTIVSLGDELVVVLVGVILVVVVGELLPMHMHFTSLHWSLAFLAEHVQLYKTFELLNFVKG